jgi:DNA-binding response OmpR family regulator
MSHDIKAGLTAGFDNYLIKPINIQELLDNLQHYLPES